MATATLGVVEDAVDMMPNGILASEKWDPLGILNQDRIEAMVWTVLRSVFAIVKSQLDCDRNDFARNTRSDMIAIVYSCADDGL
jgi:hypothetical protein